MIVTHLFRFEILEAGDFLSLFKPRFLSKTVYFSHPLQTLGARLAGKKITLKNIIFMQEFKLCY